MKNDELYKYYITYLNSRLLEGKINNGTYSLFKICENLFNEFKIKFINNKTFIRDIKIYKIIND